MASGTISGTTNNQYIDSKIEWSAKANNDSNNSSVTASLYLRRNNTGFTTEGTGSFTLNIGGQPTTVTDKHLVIQNAWVLVMTATKTITHTSDGSKSITISATGSLPPTTLQSISCSGTAKLDNIPRASTITSASDKNLGEKCSVKWTPLSASFRYKLEFSIGDWSYTTGAIHPNSTSAYTYTGYTFPYEIANEITGNPPKGTVTVKLYTFSDSAATKQIGSPSSKEFFVYVQCNEYTKPTMTVTLSPLSSLGDKFSSIYIQGKSKVQAVFSDISAKYGAEIKTLRLTVDGASDSSSPYQSGYLSKSTKAVSYISDSRGNFNEYETDITVIPYRIPQLLKATGESDVICARCDSNGNLSDSGTYLKIKAKRDYSFVQSGNTQYNFCLIEYRIKKESGSFGSWTTILAKTDTSTDEVNAKLDLNLSQTNAYIVQVRVSDDIDGAGTARTFSIPTDKVFMHKRAGGTALGLGEYVDEDYMFSVAEDWNVRFRGGLNVGGRSGVESLKLGIALVAGEDLDTKRTVGNYYSPSVDISSTLLNTPYTGGGFRLTVRELQSTNYLSQLLHYGRTFLTRHYNGSEWSEWVRILTTDILDSHAKDFVIEEGTKNGWTYKKWKSGTYEMFGYFTVTTTAAGTANGSLYHSEQFALPTPFRIDSAVVSGSALSWFVVISGGQASTDADNNVGFRLFRPTAFDVGTSISVRLHVIGKYL